MNRPEQDMHKAVAAHLRARGAIGLVWWHTPNGARVPGRRGHIQGAIAKGMGVRAGVSDIIALHRGKFYALELKAPGGRPTDDQLTFLHEVREQGGFGSIAEGLDDALHTLEFWGLLRGVSA